MKSSYKKQPLSLGLLVPFLWGLTSATRFLEIFSPVEDAKDFAETIDFESGSPIGRNVISALIALGIFILARRNIYWEKLFKDNFFVFLLFIYMGLSILWSDIPFVSFKRWIKTIGVLVMVFVVLSEKDSFYSMTIFLRRLCIVIITSSLFFILFVPSLGTEFSTYTGQTYLIGVTTQKNQLGQVALLSSIFFVFNIFRKGFGKKIFPDIIYLILSLLTLAATNSMTSIFVLFICLAFLLILIVANKMKLKYVGTLIFVMMLIFFSSYRIVEDLIFEETIMASLVEVSGHDMTLSGRTELWHDVLELANLRPMLGYGYGSFWVGDIGNDLWEKYVWHPNQAHQGFIDVYVQLGLIGLILMLAVIGGSLRKMFVLFNSGSQQEILRIVLLIMVIFNNLTESSLCNLTHLYWFIFLLVAVVPPKLLRTKAETGEQNRLLKLSTDNRFRFSTCLCKRNRKCFCRIY